MEELQYEREAVNRMQQLGRLLKNKDFKSLFVEGYLKDDFIYLGLNLATLPADKRESIQEQVMARGIFKQYIDSIITAGQYAQNTIDEEEVN